MVEFGYIPARHEDLFYRNTRCLLRGVRRRFIWVSLIQSGLMGFKDSQLRRPGDSAAVSCGPDWLMLILKKLKYLARKADIMDAEEIAKKYSMNELRPIAKKYGIATRCVKKIDIVKAFPPEAIAELEDKKA